MKCRNRDKELEKLIKQIIKTKSSEKKEETVNVNDYFETLDKEVKNIKNLIKQIIKTKSSEKKEEIEKIDDYFDEFNADKIKEFEKGFLDELDSNERVYDLFMKEVMPDSYKLRLHYGGDVFEGYYDKVIESVKQCKGTSFTSMAREYEAETLRNSLIIIRKAKENKSTVMVLSPEEQACVDSFKAQSLTWWQILYELEGKIIF